MIVPDNSAIMLDEETKKAWGIIDEKKVTEYYRAKTNSLQTGIRYVMLYEALSAKKNEYIYFKTDHHWTHLGAYYAYVTFCRAKGITPHSLSEYDTNYIPKFTGSYVTASGFSQLDMNPDTVTSYVPITYNQFSFSLRESPSTWWENKLIVRDLSGAGVHSAYQSYIYGDNPISTITNPTIHNGESCIIVKDSFGNAFSTFLTDHYEKVYILDYRYYDGNIVDLAKENHITDLIFELNVDTASYLPHMEFIKQRCYGTK